MAEAMVEMAQTLDAFNASKSELVKQYESNNSMKAAFKEARELVSIVANDFTHFAQRSSAKQQAALTQAMTPTFRATTAGPKLAESYESNETISAAFEEARQLVSIADDSTHFAQRSSAEQQAAFTNAMAQDSFRTIAHPDSTEMLADSYESNENIELVLQQAHQLVLSIAKDFTFFTASTRSSTQQAKALEQANKLMPSIINDFMLFAESAKAADKQAKAELVHDLQQASDTVPSEYMAPAA